MKHLVIIDGFSFLFRAYHAVRGNLVRESDGLPTNALYGFSQMLLKVIKDLEPDLCCVALDSKGKTFRHDIYPAYKANRSEPAPEMLQQIELFQPLIESFGILGLGIPHMEADDIIATLATTYGIENKVTIVSSDKDLLQLIGGNVFMTDTMKDKTYDKQAVFDKFEVFPENMIDFQALVGDSSDNVPGIKGIGPKTASTLINNYHSLDGVYDNLDSIKQSKMKENLIEYKNNAYISKELVTLKTDLELPEIASALLFKPNFATAQEFMLNLGFKTLAARVGKISAHFGKEKNIEKTKGYTGIDPLQANSVGLNSSNSRKTADSSAHFGPTLLAEGGQRDSTVQKASENDSRYQTVTKIADLEKWISICEKNGLVAFDTETTSLDSMQAELVGVSLAVVAENGEIEACYIPVGHVGDGDGFITEEIDQIAKKEVLTRLQPLLANKNVKKVAHNLKYDWKVLLGAYDLSAATPPTNLIANFEDTMLLSASLDAGKHGHGLDALAKHHFGHEMIKFVDVAGRGKAQVTFDRVPLDVAVAYAGEDADITLRLYLLFNERLERV